MNRVVDWDTWQRRAPKGREWDHVGSALRDAPWFEHVGEASSHDGAVARVRSWAEACTMFARNGATAPSGTLRAPKSRLAQLLDRDPEMARRTAHAANSMLDSMRFTHRIPDSLGLDVSVAIGDYVSEFVRLLCIEWHAGEQDESGFCYFREQLPWFAAGFLPCGWDGPWPDGKMRVF